MARFLDSPSAPVTFAQRVPRDNAVVTTTAYIGTCVLAIAAPFELSRPLVDLPLQSVSSVEAVSLAGFGTWLLSIAWSRTWPSWRTPLTRPWLVLLAAMSISAVSAPTGRVNALHMTGRLTFGLAVLLLTVSAGSTPGRIRRVMTAVFLSGLTVATLAILEYLQVGVVLQGLRAFRPDVSVVGAQVRAGGTLQYPTIASMYLEIVFAFGLGILLAGLDGRRVASVAATFLGLAAIAEAVTLTFTRAGLVTMATSLLLVGGTRYRQRGADGGVRLVAALAVMILVLFATSQSTQSLWLRLTSEGQEAWYRFAVDAPAELTLGTGALETVPVRATNSGRVAWDSRADPPFYLSYHWLQADADRVVIFEGSRTSFTAPVSPGTTVPVQAQVRAPILPGHYRLMWDVVQENRLWFSTEPGAATAAFSRVTVSGPPAEEAVATSPLPLLAVRPGRLLLWRAAARMFAAHPILGVGPDNFRLLYGPYAGLVNADARIHSNNMYIEMAVGGGLLGGVGFLWLVWRAAGRCAAAVTVAAASERSWAIGIAAAGLAVLIHGFVDSFLSFTPIYIVISITLGLAVACTSGAETLRVAG